MQSHNKSLCLVELSGDVLSLLNDGELDALALGEGDLSGLVASGAADDKHILLAGGESLAGSVTKDDNVERTGVVLDTHNDAHASSRATLGDHGGLTGLELEDLDGLASGKINLHSVVHLGSGVRVTDGAAIVGGDGGDLLQGQLLSLDTAQLELGLLLGDAVQHKAALGIEQQTESVTSLGDLNNIAETSGEVGIGADLAVNLNVLLHADHLGLLTGQSVFKSVSKDQDQGHRLSQLVGALRRSGSLFHNTKQHEQTMRIQHRIINSSVLTYTYPDTLHLGKHPVLGHVQSLQMLLRSSCLNIQKHTQ